MSTSYTVKDIEELLFSVFPQTDAESWDRVGISVGNPSETVTKIACALDVTPQSIRAARDKGANLLVTHHPIFIDPPFPVIPEEGGGHNPGTSLYEAIRCGVSLIAMHTNLDRSQKASRIIPDALGLTFIDQFEDRAQGGRLGAVSIPSERDQDLTVEALALRAEAAWGRKSRVWGSPTRTVKRVVSATGSLSSLYKDVLANDIDTVICGESSYHNLLDMTLSGRSIIVLGHDVSELPLVLCLRDVLIDSGIPQETVHVLSEQQRWTTVD